LSREYKIFGAELSPYSVKTRSYFRYKKIPHEWLLRSPSNADEFKKYAKLPIVPLVVTPNKEGMQDSTPIMDKMEDLFPEPQANPKDEVLKFISILLEEYSDEWGNKHMFHYRWKAKVDQMSASRRIAEVNMPFLVKFLPIVNTLMKNKIAKTIKERMSKRLWVIGSNENTENQITKSFHNLLSKLNHHLKRRKYIFGDKPSYADFGLWGQIYNSWTDPTPRKIIESDFSELLPWINRMLNPQDEGEYESWESLSTTLIPLLTEEVGETFLPWTSEVTKSILEKKEEISVLIQGKEFRHSLGGPQKYHVKSLAVLKKKFILFKNNETLTNILLECKCLNFLK
tara:strand:+ start:1601 stop:2626 length:1026 start_codon:yes stop_codon:yes gene_type:complete